MHVRQFLVKNKTVIMPQPLFSPDLSRWHFSLSKTEDTDGAKRKIETGTVGDTKKYISEVFRGLEKALP